MTESRGRRGGPVAQAVQLAKALDEMVTAIDQARSMGLEVDVPAALYRACREIIARYESPSGLDMPGAQSNPRAPAASGRAVGGASIHDVPLRRLVWQVIDPGEEFTVTDVAERLADLGVWLSANKVSNALGYWVSRGRLTRQRKGTYRYPIITNPSRAVSKTDAPQEVPASRRETLRREEETGDSVQRRQRQAM